MALELLEQRLCLAAATINWTTQQQTIAGFGSSSAWNNLGNVDSSQQQLLWSHHRRSRVCRCSAAESRPDHHVPAAMKSCDAKGAGDGRDHLEHAVEPARSLEEQ